ncbi:CRISPR-associated endonuclease Cas1 1 [archaeon HR01]|nr:CRISPR-associated endonuclease Cas1 1 [archaeon HR01]
MLTVPFSGCVGVRAKTVLIDQYGSFLGVRQGRFFLKVGGKVRWELAPSEIDSIVITTDGSALSAAAVSLATTFGVDLVFMSREKPLGRVISYKYGTLMRSWLLQLKVRESGSAELARLFLDGKLHNQRMVILEYARRLRGGGKMREAGFLEDKANEIAKRSSELAKTATVEELLVIEAHAAKSYWEAVSEILPRDLGFSHRYTRSNPPGGEMDKFNISLNLGYALLRKEVWRAVFLAGLNPYLGFLHKPRGGRPALVLDLMEEFRAVSVDRPLIGLARTDKYALVKIGENGSDALRRVWSHLVKYMRESNPSHVELINSQARKLVLHLRGVGRYTPFKSRW